MTGASKLFFHSRRVRFGIRNNTVDDAEPDSSAAAAAATTNRHHHHPNNRQDLDGCNNPPHRIHRHRQSDHEPVHLEQRASQSPSGSIIGSEDFRSLRRWGATGNDRLPGVVLLARERLVERLRGVHVSESRESSRLSSLRELSYNNRLQETVMESWQAVMPTPSTRRMLPRGLDEDAINNLVKNIFNKSDESNEGSRECSICLEGFKDGDELINLACLHRFHSSCLFPWVEVCGACPNCRKDIVAGL